MEKEEKLLPPPHDMELDSGFSGQLLSDSSGKKKAPFRIRPWLIIVFLLLVSLLLPVMFIITQQSSHSETVTPPPKRSTPSPAPSPYIPTASAADTDTWTNFSSRHNGQRIRLKYPSEMKVDVTKKTSEITPESSVPTITLTGPSETVTLSLEKNTVGSLSDWVSQHGTKQPVRPIELMDRQAIIQNSADQTTIHVYTDYDAETVVWIRSTQGNPKTSEVFPAMLRTIQIGE